MQAMTRNEMVQTGGGAGPVIGGLLWIAGVVVVAGVTVVSENWSDFKKGVVEGFNGTTASN